MVFYQHCILTYKCCYIFFFLIVILTSWRIHTKSALKVCNTINHRFFDKSLTPIIIIFGVKVYIILKLFLGIFSSITPSLLCHCAFIASAPLLLCYCVIVPSLLCYCAIVPSLLCSYIVMLSSLLCFITTTPSLLCYCVATVGVAPSHFFDF
jgi:hypothetical protein